MSVTALDIEGELTTGIDLTDKAPRACYRLTSIYDTEVRGIEAEGVTVTARVEVCSDLRGGEVWLKLKCNLFEQRGELGVIPEVVPF